MRKAATARKNTAKYFFLEPIAWLAVQNDQGDSRPKEAGKNVSYFFFAKSVKATINTIRNLL